MKNKNKLKLSIIGYGGMGGWHAEQIKNNIEQIELKGIFDIRPEACEKANDDGLYVYKSLDELLADDEIDIITIATPNDVHKNLAVRCMQAGKHVVCEKPVAMNSAELEKMIEAAQQTGKVFSIHQNRRWDKDFCTVKNILQQNTIGKPYFIESRVQGSRGAMHGWRGYKQNGGGMLLDWGVHLIDQMLLLIPEKVVAVNADLVKVFSTEVEDSIKLTLRFESGVSALLEMSTNCFINHPRWHICGTDGTAVINDWSCEGEVVKLNTAAEMEWADDIVYTEAGPTRTMAPRPAHTTQRLPLPLASPDVGEYYRNIAAAVNGEAELIVKPQEALRVMRVIDLLFESEDYAHGLECNI